MKSRDLVGLLAAGLFLSWMPGTSAQGSATLRNVCRVRGQEEISALPTIRSLATMMQLLGVPLGADGAAELKDAKNVALVIVTTTIPAAGARRGDRLDCKVSAISAKSLAGGRLFSTPLTGPVPQQNPVVFALAEGDVTVDDQELATTGRVHRGCQLLEDFFNPFSEDGSITLVVDRDYASFQVAQEIADLINSRMAPHSSEERLAKAIDQVHVEVTVPPEYRDYLVQFVSEILSLEMLELATGPRVVIHERTGTIVIDGDVEIGPVLVTHRNIVVEAGGEVAAGQFVPVDSQSDDNPKLKALLAALEAVRVPSEDKIEILKALHRNGRLYAQLIIE